MKVYCKRTKFNHDEEESKNNQVVFNGVEFKVKSQKAQNKQKKFYVCADTNIILVDVSLVSETNLDV